jgi:hypothetical protein
MGFFSKAVEAFKGIGVVKSGATEAVKAAETIEHAAPKVAGAGNPYAAFANKPFANAPGFPNTVMNGELNAGAGVSGLFDNLYKPKPSMSNNIFSEASDNKWAKGAARAANGAWAGLFTKGSESRGLMARTAASSVMGGVIGGGFGAAGSFVFPNNVEYQGTVAPILKGAVAGIAIGAAHGAAGRLISKYPNNSMIQEFANKTQSVTNSKLLTGAIGVGVAAGTTNTNFTNPINRVNGV